MSACMCVFIRNLVGAVDASALVEYIVQLHFEDERKENQQQQQRRCP